MSSQWSRSTLEIDLGKVKKNLQTINESVSPAQVMPVLKANAYGMGLLEVAGATQTQASLFGVANLEEALILLNRSSGSKKPVITKPVQILGSVTPLEVEECVKNQIIMPVADRVTLRLISEAARKLETKAKVRVLVDTGMGRLGVAPDSAESLLDQATTLKEIEFLGLYSHFPSAFEDHEFSLQQVSQLKEVIKKLQEKEGARIGARPLLFDIANSDGINNIAESYQAPFNLVRTGINLYGYFDDHGVRRLPLEKVFKLQSTLVAVRSLKKGQSVGYGRDYVLKKNQRVGTVAIGYADGLPMQISGAGHFEVQGKLCPVIGRISMDYTTIDLSEVPEAQVGESVTCLGGSLTCEQWARYKDTITYEVICSIGNRVRRVYLDTQSEPKV